MSRFLFFKLLLILIVFITAQIGLGMLIVPKTGLSNIQKAVAVLINNDDSQRHRDNIIAAQHACEKLGLEAIVVTNEKGGIPNRKQVIETLEQIQESGRKLSLLYLTGHGLMLFNGSEKPLSSIHFKDGPLIASDIAHLLEPNTVTIYIDVCFASGWVQELDRELSGRYLLLSDKPVNYQQRSCRGVSVQLWQLVEKDEAQPVSLALYHAWESVCPDGVYINHLGGSSCSLIN